MSLEKTLFKTIRNTFAAIAMASVLSACPHPTSPNPANQTQSSTTSSTSNQTENQPAPQLSQNAIVIPEYTSEKISSVDSNSITLSEGVNSLAPGKIIISNITPSAPQGFIRKITGISTDGKTLTTENASLEEVVDNYSFNSTQELTPSNVKSVALSRGVSSRSSADLFDFNCPLSNVVLYDIDGDLSTTGDQIIANGNVSFNSKFNLEFKIENFEMKNLTFKNITQENINVTVSSPKEFLSLSKSYKIAHYDFNPFVIGLIPTVPPIPIIVTPKLDVNLIINGNSSSLITATLTQNADLTLGVDYSNNSWTPISVFNNNFPKPSIQFPKKSSFGIIPGEKLSLLVYDSVAGLYGQLKEFVTFSSYPQDNNLEWLIQGGLTGEVGIDMGIFKKLIPDYSAKVLQYTKVIDSGEIINGAPMNKFSLSADSDSYIAKNIYSNGTTTYSVVNSDSLEVHNGYASSQILEDTLIKFPTPNIPANSFISSAKIKLYGSGANKSNTNPITINLKKINYSWDEQTKWNDSFTDGEDISNSIVKGTKDWYEWDITSLVKDWMQGYSNYGMLLYTSENSAAEFYSSEYSVDSAKRPILEITYY